MTLRKTILILFLLLVNVILMSCVESNKYNSKILKGDTEMIEKKVEEKGDGKLKFIIFSDNEKCKMDESIYIEFSLKNITEESIIVNKRFVVAYPPEGEISLNIIGPDGKLREFNSFIQVDFPTKDDFIILNSNESVKTKYNIKKFYLLGQIGQYKITATYEFRKNVLESIREYRRRWSKIEIPAKAWTGSIKSNTIEIEIIP